MRKGALRSGFISLTIVGLLSFGCKTPAGKRVEHGPFGTIAYYVPIDSSEPGARIQVDGEFVGTTPMMLRIYGDRDGTFHDFNSYDFVVRAFPPGAGRRSVAKVYRTGALGAPEDKIPERIYFNFQLSKTSNP